MGTARIISNTCVFIFPLGSSGEIGEKSQRCLLLVLQRFHALIFAQDYIAIRKEKQLAW